MPITTVYPTNYLLANTQQTKQLNVVLQVEGYPEVFSVVPVYEKIKYGDPRLKYGIPGLVYGGLIAKDGVRPYLMVEGGLTIGQKVEPEQGRASISTLTFQFIDKDGYMSKFISPGQFLDEPMGGKLCTVWLGYTNTSYPDDYFVVFRGFITETSSQAGKVIIQLSDANLKRRSEVFPSSKTKLSQNLGGNPGDLTVYLDNTSSLYDYILGPDGTYDTSTVQCFLKIESEYMSYAQSSISSTSVTVNLRGARATTRVAHNLGTEVSNGVELTGNVIDLMLKIMLSGWNGPWVTGVQCVALGTTLDPLNVQNAAVLLKEDSDVIYGLVIGDYVTISGSGSGNNGTYQIIDIQDSATDKNRVLILNQNLTIENPATSVSLAFRSKYDTLPVTCGLKGTPQEIDVKTHEEIRSLFFSANTATVKVFLQSSQTGKTFIESQLCLPFGLYSITRYGRISLAATKPPLANESLVYLDASNIIDPQAITVKRALNNRRFYNVVTLDYDQNDDGTYLSGLRIFDSDSLNLTQYPSTLPIESSAVKTSTGSAILASSRARFLLNRFKKAAIEITFKVNWQAGSLIEVGDPVVLTDNGNLKITNFDTGQRDLGQQLFEVLQRQFNIKEGNVTLTLLSSIGYKLGQRFATIAPSSFLGSGSTSTQLKLKASFGGLYNGLEYKKWQKLVGNQIIVHNYAYSVSGVTTIQSFDLADPFKMNVSPALAFTPAADYIVDLAPYSTGGTDPKANELSKLLYAFFDPIATVLTGISQTQFTVSVFDAVKFQTGYPVLIHSSNYSQISQEVIVTNITGNTITVDSNLGFTPAAGMKVELIGFLDGGGPYRIL